MHEWNVVWMADVTIVVYEYNKKTGLFETYC